MSPLNVLTVQTSEPGVPVMVRTCVFWSNRAVQLGHARASSESSRRRESVRRFRVRVIGSSSYLCHRSAINERPPPGAQTERAALRGRKNVGDLFRLQWSGE